jgi:hypothetical protein
MELEVSLPCSQEPSTGPYPEPDESNAYFLTLFPQDPSDVVIPLAIFSKSVTFMIYEWYMHSVEFFFHTNN